MTKDMTQGSPLKLILAFAVPLMLGSLFQQFYNLADTIIVGRFVGVEALAAVGSVGGLNYLVLGFVNGIACGFSIPISWTFGAKDYKEMRRYTANTVWLSIFFAVVLTIVTVALTRSVLVWTNTPENIIDLADIYIRTIFAGIPFTLLYNVTSARMRALGDSKRPLYFLLVASVLNIGLDLLCILIFRMGAFGAAFATVFSQAVAGIGSLVYIVRHYPELKWSREEGRLSASHCLKLCNLGIPMGLQCSITAIGSVVLQGAVNGLGSSIVAAQTAGGKAASNGASAARSGVEQAVEKGKTAVSTAVKGLMNAAKGNAHVLVIVGVFLLLILMVMSGFSSCGILFGSGTQVSGQTMYSAEDRDIRGAEQDYKKLEKELDKKIKRTPADHPGYNEYQYHLGPIEHDPWQLTSFLTTLYDDYTRSEVQGKLKETFKKQYKLTTWVEVQIRYKTVWVISPAGIPVPTQVPYEYRIFHTKLVNRGLEVVIREELNADQWKRYEIFQDTLGGRPYLFNGGLPPGGSDGSGTPGIDYQIPAEALTDSEFAAIYKEAQKYVGTPYVWGGSTPETGFDCSGYVCWVYNQNGYDVGRTTANGLWQKSQHISEAEAKPGDLVFFEGTYDTPGKSHVGIYLGNGKMVSAGDPIKYADIHSSYWQKYLSGFGRLSK